MIRQMRFGKSIPLPSAQIKHELKLMDAADAVAAAAGKPITLIEIAAVAKRNP